MSELRAVEVVLDGGDELGEGPVWDAARGQLTRVDIVAGVLHRFDPVGGAAEAVSFGAPLAFALPTAAGGVVVGRGRGVELHEPGAEPLLLATVEAGREANRFNDAKCDPAGRLWAGTMSTVGETGAAALYRLDDGLLGERAEVVDAPRTGTRDGDGAREGAERSAAAAARVVVPGTTVSNGLGWSPAGDRFFFADSPTQRIDCFDFDARDGTLGERRPFATVDVADGLPDGLAVDAEGGVWVCLFGGGQVRRYDADGRLDAVVPVPVTNPTSCAFGGPRLDELFVTSARVALTDEQLAREPAGALLRLRPGVRGLPTTPFRPPV